MIKTNLYFDYLLYTSTSISNYNVQWTSSFIDIQIRTFRKITRSYRARRNK